MAARRYTGGRSRGWRWWSLRTAAVALFLVSAAAGGVVGRQLVQLDRVVRQRFEGKLFRVPSRVMSAPIILYPGLDPTLLDLRGTLQRLGYREATGEALPLGRFRWTKQELRIHRRAFERHLAGFDFGEVENVVEDLE